MARDAQRARVYAAEEFVRSLFDRAQSRSGATVDFFGATLTLPPEARFGSVASVRTYVDGVLGHPAVRERWPDAPPLAVRSRRGSTAAHYEVRDGRAAIAVPDGAAVSAVAGGSAPWALRELVVFFGHFAAVYGVRAEDSGVHRRYGRFPRITYRMPSWGSAIDRSMVATDCPGSAPA